MEAIFHFVKPMIPDQQKNGNDHHIAMVILCAGILSFCYMSRPTNEGLQLGGFHMPALCAFKLLTTMDCPGCGLTRSLSMALHGEFRASFLLHIWGIPLLLFFVAQILYGLRLICGGSPVKWTLPRPILRWISPVALLSLLIPWFAKSIALLIIQYL